jgi:hypothetical protein
LPGLIGCAMGMDEQVANGLINQWLIIGLILANQLVNLTQPPLHIEKMQGGSVDRIGGKCQLKVLAGAFPGIERVARKALG